MKFSIFFSLSERPKPTIIRVTSVAVVVQPKLEPQSSTVKLLNTHQWDRLNTATAVPLELIPHTLSRPFSGKKTHSIRRFSKNPTGPSSGCWKYDTCPPAKEEEEVRTGRRSIKQLLLFTFSNSLLIFLYIHWYIRIRKNFSPKKSIYPQDQKRLPCVRAGTNNLFRLLIWRAPSCVQVSSQKHQLCIHPQKVVQDKCTVSWVTFSWNHKVLKKVIQS